LSAHASTFRINYELELAEDARGAEIAERIRPRHAALPWL